MKSILMFLMMLPLKSAAIITVRRHLQNQILWSSCNSFGICYTLKTERVDVGSLTDRYYTGPVEIQIYRKRPDGSLQWHRRIQAHEGQWNYSRNQWVLLLPSSRGSFKEFIFAPDQLRE